MSLCLAESPFTSPPEGFGELERNGREQSEQPAEWALGSRSSIAGSSTGEVIEKGGGMSSEPALGVFQEFLIFFMALDESVCPGNKSDESRK